jgi:N-acetylmuramoyl-L-alanine amidase
VKARLGICLLLVTTACAGGSGGLSTTVGQPSRTTTPASSTTSATITATATTIPTTIPPPLAGRTVVIDPGHNGMNWAHRDEIARLVDIGNGTKACNTTGSNTADGYTEAEFNWALAQLVVPRLEELGAEVVLTRRDNEGWGPCIDERAATGNRNHADAVISIHADGGPEGGRGFHVIRPASIEGLTDDIYEDSTLLAQALHDSYLSTQMPLADYTGEGGYSERRDLGGLNLSDVPAVFLEAGNMRNETDAELLADPSFRNAAADAITIALVEFLTN